MHSRTAWIVSSTPWRSLAAGHCTPSLDDVDPSFSLSSVQTYSVAVQIMAELSRHRKLQSPGDADNRRIFRGSYHLPCWYVPPESPSGLLCKLSTTGYTVTLCLGGYQPCYCCLSATTKRPQGLSQLSQEQAHVYAAKLSGTTRYIQLDGYLETRELNRYTPLAILEGHSAFAWTLMHTSLTLFSQRRQTSNTELGKKAWCAQEPVQQIRQASCGTFKLQRFLFAQIFTTCQI
jgi:hypothetical protein